MKLRELRILGYLLLCAIFIAPLSVLANSIIMPTESTVNLAPVDTMVAMESSPFYNSPINLTQVKIGVAANDYGNTNETDELHNTLEQYGFNHVVVDNVSQAIALECDVLIDLYSAVNFPSSDIADWLNASKGYIQLGDWPSWFPNGFTSITEHSSVTCTLVDSHPITEGLPDSWTTNGFWYYGYTASDYVGWCTNTSLPNIANVDGYDRAITAEEVGPGRAVYLGFNVYGSAADIFSESVLVRSILWSVKHAFIEEAETIKVAFLPGWGSSTNFALIYRELMTNWFMYGNYKLNVTDIPSPFTYGNLVDMNADVVLIVDPAGMSVQYSQSEINAIQTFLERDAPGIFVSYLLTYGGANNSMLAPLVGVDGEVLHRSAAYQNNTYDLYQPGHPIFANMTDPWNSSGYPYSQNITVSSWHEAILDGAQIVAETPDSQGAIISYQNPLWKGIWATSMVDYYGNEMDKQFVYNSFTWLALPTHVVIDDALAVDARIGVSTQEQVGFHAKWSHDGSDVTDGTIYINDIGYSVNETGWISFPVEYDTVGKRSWTVTGVNCSYITIYEQTVEDTEIIWDNVQITLSIADDHINVGDSANIVQAANYEYDGTLFMGTITLNDTLTKNAVGKYWFTAASITDPTHGITQFESNSVHCIFNKVTVTLNVSDNLISVDTTANITWIAVYEYPSVGDYDGFVELNDTTTKSSAGSYTYTVSRIGGDTYGITAFDTDTVTVTFAIDTDRDGIPNTIDTDDDNDGMPDTWETDNELDPLDPTDAALDNDGDGTTNLQEYQEETDPNVSDAFELLWIIIIVAVALVGVAIAVIYFLMRGRPRTS